MDLSEKEWDDAKQFWQYMLEQGEDESEAVVEFRRQYLAAYLVVLGFCHKGSDDAALLHVAELAYRAVMEDGKEQDDVSHG